MTVRPLIALAILLVAANQQASVAEPTGEQICPTSFVSKLAELDQRILQASQQADGRALVDGLSALVALERGSIQSACARYLPLTSTEDFDKAADLIAGDAALTQKLLSLTPLRNRGRNGGPLQQAVLVTRATPFLARIDFTANSPASVYIRDSEPGTLRLTITPVGSDTPICTSFVTNGSPICGWDVGIDTVEFEIAVEIINSDRQSFLLIVA